MTDCRPIEALLPPYVDGEAQPDAVAVVEQHLAFCPTCRHRVAAERTARAVLRARAAALRATAPPGLRTRLLATLDQGVRRRLGWKGRLTAVAAAAAILFAIVTAIEFVIPQANVLFAAQLALDHVRCFIIERDTTDEVDARALEQRLARDYGWSIAVPDSNGSAGVTLVAARRCPYWLGPYAHLLYRTAEGDVSLYVASGRTHAAEQLRLLGHVERIWTVEGTTYALIARGLTPAALDRAAGYLESATKTAISAR